MYDVDAVLTKQFNVFDSYSVGKYLYLHNLSVDKRFRGFNIGLQMIEARLVKIFQLSIRDSLVFHKFLYLNFLYVCES